MAKTTVNVVGAGRVGQTFLRLFAQAKGISVQDVARGAQARQVVADIGQGRACALADMRPADLWCLTVPDGQIAAVASELSQGEAVRGACVIHCSGFHRAQIMAPLRSRGCHLASCHPVLSFADAVSAAEVFAGTYCGLEGDALATALMEDVVSAMGGRAFPIRSEAKALYHGAAVLSNNFTVVLQALAAEAWAEAGVPEHVAHALGTTLLDATARNVAALGPQAALTGPAARGDIQVVQAQAAEMTHWSEDTGMLYTHLSTMAARLKKTGQAHN